MKTVKLFSAASLLLLLVPEMGASQANRKLSNLNPPTQINASLLPYKTNSVNLGSSNKKWKNAYLSGSIQAGHQEKYVRINGEADGIYVEGGYSSYGIHIVQQTGGDGLYVDQTGGTAVYGDAYGAGAIGVKGSVSSSDSGFTSYAGYFDVPGGAPAYYAGFFNGDVYISAGLFVRSDRKLKTGITPLEKSLAQLMKLKPSTFLFKTAEYSQMQLPRNNQMGLIADEVKQVFSELVKEQVQPPVYSKDKKEVQKAAVRFDAINYIGFIPVLIASIQEQQKSIAELSSRNEDLQKQNNDVVKRIEKLESLVNVRPDISLPSSKIISINDASLEQNIPNPFSKTTTIGYTLPQKFTNAQIVITDKNGKTLKKVNVSGAGKGTLNVDAATLASGAYSYSLVIDGRVIGSKQMEHLR